MPITLPNKTFRPWGSALLNMARLRLVLTRTRVAQLVLTRTFLVYKLSFLAPSLKEAKRFHASSRELVLYVVFLCWWHASLHLRCGCWTSVRGRCPLTSLHVPTTRAQTLQIMATFLQRLQNKSLKFFFGRVVGIKHRTCLPPSRIKTSDLRVALF